MAFFDDVFDRLFSNKAPAPKEFINEVLVRSPKEEQAYKTWLETEEATDLIRDIQSAYYLKKSGIESALSVHLFNTNYANGFAVTYHEDISDQHFKFLFDYLKDQTLTLNYRLAQKDRRVLYKESFEESIEKWYLKPKRGSGNENGRFDQLYGNVLIEHVEIDRKPSYIKLLVNIYQDRLYTKALSFDDFINELFPN